MSGSCSRPPPIERVEVHAYTVPTDQPESDGTFAWSSTTMVLAEVRAGTASGLGYSYTDSAAAEVVRTLAPVLAGRDPMDVPAAATALAGAVRNIGRSGVALAAISALDVALWDLKARLLDVPLVGLLGGARDGVPVYGSGGFTSYSIGALREQLGGWAADGIRMVKMKVGRCLAEDPARMRAAREAIGPDVALFIDANGACSISQARRLAEDAAEQRVTWFEEPVSSDDLDGLRRVRDGAPAGMDVAAGEYGDTPFYFRRMLGAGAVDCLQADATRCGGITGFLRAGVLCEAYATPLSAHTAPALHLHACAADPRVRHIEYFHDHVRIEQLLFDGVRQPVDGALSPDRSRPGHGLLLKRADARRYEVI